MYLSPYTLGMVCHCICRSSFFCYYGKSCCQDMLFYVTLSIGQIVCTWREKVGEKYSSLPENCMTLLLLPCLLTKWSWRFVRGPLQDTPTKHGFTADQSCVPRVMAMYKAKSLVKRLPKSKLGHLIQMQNNSIEEERWPDFITPT